MELDFESIDLEQKPSEELDINHVATGPDEDKHAEETMTQIDTCPDPMETNINPDSRNDFDCEKMSTEASQSES